MGPPWSLWLLRLLLKIKALIPSAFRSPDLHEGSVLPIPSCRASTVPMVCNTLLVTCQHSTLQLSLWSCVVFQAQNFLKVWKLLFLLKYCLCHEFKTLSGSHKTRLHFLFSFCFYHDHHPFQMGMEFQWKNLEWRETTENKVLKNSETIWLIHKNIIQLYLHKRCESMS